MKERKIKFIVVAVRWFDRLNGNTYHSVRVERMKDGKVITSHMQYGYEDHYKQTALQIMFFHRWLPKKYGLDRHHKAMNDKTPVKTSYMLYERENNYPIIWNVSDGLKRECVANGTLNIHKDVNIINPGDVSIGTIIPEKED